MNDRDLNDPRYKAWRWKCLSRDRFTCQVTGEKGGDLQVHHIRRWADYPSLRYAVSNGITLSTRIHEMVTGREKEFEKEFTEIVRRKMDEMKYKGNKKRRWKYRPLPPECRL